jgi:hypothetical protein
MGHCGHRCCRIPFNGYHAHVTPPASCPGCATGASLNLPSPPDGLAAGDCRETTELGQMVADVLAQVVPDDSDPRGAQLAEIVANHALAVYASGLVDPDIQCLGDQDRRAVLTARVGHAVASSKR